MTDDCKGEMALRIADFVVLVPINFIVWGFIGAVYLLDTKLSHPPGKLIAAEAFSCSINLVSLVALVPMFER
jgi:hypothetical protein